VTRMRVSNWETGMRKGNEIAKEAVLPAVIVGANVALAISASAGLALIGQPQVAWPICAMVAAVYGVSSTLKFFQKQS
jgi:hypothetical protein